MHKIILVTEIPRRFYTPILIMTMNIIQSKFDIYCSIEVIGGREETGALPVSEKTSSRAPLEPMCRAGGRTLAAAAADTWRPSRLFPSPLSAYPGRWRGLCSDR